MYFFSYDGCTDVGRRGRRMLVACFTKANEDVRKPHIKYDRKSLLNLLKNPPPEFEQEDHMRARCGLADLQAGIVRPKAGPS